MDIKRINELRKELVAERLSYGELSEIYSAAEEKGINVTDEMLADDVLDLLELGV